MRLRNMFFGNATREYLAYRRKERRLSEAGKRDREEDSSNKDVKMSRWVAAEEDWPAHHSADVPDHDAAKLIWSRAFTAAGNRLQASYSTQPVATPDPGADEPA